MNQYEEAQKKLDEQFGPEGKIQYLFELLCNLNSNLESIATQSQQNFINIQTVFSQIGAKFNEIEGKINGSNTSLSTDQDPGEAVSTSGEENCWIGT